MLRKSLSREDRTDSRLYFMLPSRVEGITSSIYTLAQAQMAIDSSKAQEAGYLVDGEMSETFYKALSKLVGEENRNALGQYLSAKNVHRFKHGRTWAHPNSPAIQDGEMEKHSIETATRFDDIAKHNLKVIPEFIRNLAAGLQREFMRSMYATIAESTARSGNTVEMKGPEANLEEGVYQMFEKLEFSVGENGEVTLPQIHAGHEMAKKLVELDRNATPESKARMDALLERKKREALAREQQRKAKFIGYGVLE